VRFYRQYAGGNDLNAFSLANTVFFGRNEDGVLENEFAGNLIEICPTGVFTDRTLRNHYTRKWDLRMAPSICGQCGIGCNVTAGERYGLLRRVVNRFHSEVNGYFLCDRGRFAYEFVNSPNRIRAPQLDGEAISGEAAEWELQALIANRDQLIGIGSPRASLEANFALRQLVGADRFFAGVESKEWTLITTMVEILKRGPARSPSLNEIEHSDAVLILGEDVTNSAPRMALSLRQSVREQPMEVAKKLQVPLWMDDAVREVNKEQRGPLFISAPFATRLDDVGAMTYRAAPDDVARLGFAVAHEIDAHAPEVPGLHEEVRAMARVIADALKKAKRPLVVSGPSCRSLAVVESAASVAKALCSSGQPAMLSLITLECNSFGLALLGTRSLDEAVALTAKDRTVIVLENDLYRHLPANRADAFLESAARVIVLDHLANRTAAKASLLLPAATISESDGTLVSNEGRAQRYYSVFPHQTDVRESWRWLRQPQWSSLDDVLADLAKETPPLSGVVDAAPSSEFRAAGAKVPRETHRASGRTAMTANLTVVEPKPPVDPDSALSYTMEGASLQPPGALQPFFWSPGWNSIQSVNKFQSEIGSALRTGDPGVRLIEPKGEGEYFTQIPRHFARREREWLVIPIEHIFGSEELSRHAPAVEKLVFEPYLALNVADAGSLGLEDGSGEVEIELSGTKHRLPVKVLPDLPGGIAGIPHGLPAAFGEVFPTWRRVERIQ
jgi:NADH-quinone oxidoreductase subunit G